MRATDAQAVGSCQVLAPQSLCATQSCEKALWPSKQQAFFDERAGCTAVQHTPHLWDDVAL